MTLEHAIALFDAMSENQRESVRAAWVIEFRGLHAFRIAEPSILRHAFIEAVSAKADEIERLMLAEQGTEGSA